MLDHPLVSAIRELFSHKIKIKIKADLSATLEPVKEPRPLSSNMS